MSAMPDDAVPLVLLPGLLCDEALWQHQRRDLAGRAAMQVADLTQADSIAAMAAGVLAVAPPRFALAGLSMGGYVAMEVLRQAPERVTRLALLDTTARPDTEEQGQRRRALIALAQTGRFKGVTPQLLPNLIHPDRLADEALTQIVLAMAERVGREAFFRQQTAIMGRIDSRPFLPAIRCPTLVLCGQQDALTPPEHAAEMAGLIPGATLRLVEACGHLSPLERPAVVTDALGEWLAAG